MLWRRDIKCDRIKENFDMKYMYFMLLIFFDANAALTSGMF